MKILKQTGCAILLLVVVLLSVVSVTGYAKALSEAETVKGDASITSKPENIIEQLKYSRAVEAVIWGLPIVNYDVMVQAARGIKADFNQLVYWSEPSDWKNQTLTPNTDALYIIPFFNTKEVGPVVLEIPPAEGGSIVGTIMDAWQMALEDVGPAGVDKGKGGKYLLLPPQYKDDIPDGYIVLPCSTYKGYALLRAIPKSGSDADIAAAVTYLKRIKLYPLSEAGKSPETKFVDAHDILFDANIPYDLRFFESLNAMVQTEPWLERDKVMINMLKFIGIEKGKSFSPDAKTQALLQAALVDARAWLTNYYETAFESFFPSSYWFVPAVPELVKDVTEGFSDPNSYPVDARADIFYFAFTTVKHLGAGQFYLFVSRDSAGQPLNGGKNYTLHVPAKVPVHQYWSVTLYDFETHALIRDVPYASRSSMTPELKKNDDGSVDLYFGPKPPAGKESNWIPTKEDGRFEAIFRLYGPEKEFFEKADWILPNIEEIK